MHNLGPQHRPSLYSVEGGKGAAGGPPGDGMEARVARLEVSVEHIDRNVSQMAPDLANVRERMAALEVSVSHLPGKGFIVTAVVSALAVMGALITFSDQIHALVQSVGQ